MHRTIVFVATGLDLVLQCEGAVEGILDEEEDEVDKIIVLMEIGLQTHLAALALVLRT